MRHKDTDLMISQLRLSSDTCTTTYLTTTLTELQYWAKRLAGRNVSKMTYRILCQVGH